MQIILSNTLNIVRTHGHLKTQVLLDSKYEYTCWIDVDCEVLTNIQDVFNYAQQGKIGLTEDWGRKFHQNHKEFGGQQVLI